MTKKKKKTREGQKKNNIRIGKNGKDEERKKYDFEGRTEKCLAEGARPVLWGVLVASLIGRFSAPVHRRY